MRTRVKICGMTRPQDVHLACKFGADALGFVFAPGKRQLRYEQARDLAAEVPAWVNRVGVFGPDEKQHAPAFAEACRLDTLQLHGEPDAAFCAYMRGRFSVVQALGVGGDDAETLVQRIEAIAPHVDAVLLDTARPGQLGGTGEAFDWAVLKGLVLEVPLLIAGGLTPENVGALVREHTPWGVDVSSGVEEAPGRKDIGKMSAFLAAVKKANG